jgi:stage III sporulation protein AG
MENPIWNKIKLLFFEPKPELSDAKEPSKAKLSFVHWLIILACLGLAAMILHNFFSISNEINPMMSQVSTEKETQETFGSSRSSPTTMDEYEEFYENQLADILSKAIGVGEVSVMVNLDSSEEVIVKTNTNTSKSETTEKDREGGVRDITNHSSDEQVVLVKKGSGDEPIIVKRKKPRVRGVLVVASGADNIQVKAWIIEAVQRVMDVPLHKISVLPKRK